MGNPRQAARGPGRNLNRAGPPGSFASRVLSACARRDWDPSGSSLLLCVSGGADSIALLHCFHRLAGPLGLALSAFHADHRLRPESGEDAAFVAGICAGLGVPLRTSVLDPAARLPRESTEMWARRERYARIEAAAREAGADWILTAHHRDDLVETVFQRLGRGTGPRGLAGIPFRRGRIVRPFLDLPRADIRAWLAGEGAAWREDASNADVTLDRNWYRHRYLPSLRAGDPGLDARVAALAQAVASLLPGIAALEAADDLLRVDPVDGPYLAGEGIAALVHAGDGESLRYWLRALLEAQGGLAPAMDSLPPVTPAILREFLRQWVKASDAMCVQITPELSWVRQKRGISCARADRVPVNGPRRTKKNCSPEAQRVILVNGSAHAVWRWGGRRYTLTARRTPRPADLAFPAPEEGRAIFDADLISCTLQVRTRKDGDRFSPLGMPSRSRKLKTFFNEEKVPAALRDSLPLVVSCSPHGRTGMATVGGSAGPQGDLPGDLPAPTGEIPAWIPGYGISDFFKVSGSTTHILELVMKCENP
jgi:tRNA(Ile)-lysidine synthase